MDLNFGGIQVTVWNMDFGVVETGGGRWVGDSLNTCSGAVGGRPARREGCEQLGGKKTEEEAEEVEPWSICD